MLSTFAMRLRFLLRLALTIISSIASVPAARAAAVVQIDSPAPNATVRQPFAVIGWTLDPNATNSTGIDAIQVWAIENFGAMQAHVFVPSSGEWGWSRSDVAAAYGQQFQPSGYGVTLRGLTPGQYFLVVFVHSTVDGLWYSNYSNAGIANVLANPVMSLDAPANGADLMQPFAIGGWAVDLASATGTGVYMLHFWAIPTDGSAGRFVGVATPENGGYGVTRTDVGAAFGDHFSASGFNSSVSGLPAGEYDLIAYAYSTVSNDFTLSQSARIRVHVPPPAPTIAPGGGTFTAPQLVQITTTAGYEVRFTRDGTTPTSASELYSVPFTLAANAAIRAIALEPGFPPGPVTAADFAFITAAPSIAPAPGQYPGAQTVTLTAVTPASTIYWTDDGTDPTSSSSVYVTPIPVPAGTSKTIKARAIRAGWPQSPVVGGAYTADFTGPITITAQKWPPANAAGWNNSDLTVSFTCANATTCPSPVVVTQETAGQTISGTATNADRSQTTSIPVKLDKTAPIVTLTSPSTGQTTTDAVVLMTGSVSDGLSGVTSIRCNGTSTTISPTITCNATLNPARNSVVLTAVDAAGNSAAAGAQVTRTGTPTSLRITPAQRTLTVGEQRTLVAVDEFGVRPAAIAWTSSSVSVASVDGPTGLLTATAVGQATITASVGGLTGTLDLYVVAPGADGELPPGTKEWTVAASSPNSTIQWAVPANRMPDGADFFVMEHNAVDGSDVLRALRTDGVQLWSEQSPTDSPYSGYGFADAYGGVVGVAGIGTSGPVSLVRFGGPASAAPWQYESTGIGLGFPAQAHDGTIYVPEFSAIGSNDQAVTVVAIHGETGVPMFRVPLPPSGVRTNDLFNTAEPIPTIVNPIAIGSDDSAYLQTNRTNVDEHWESRNGVAMRVSSKVNVTITLWRIDPDGSSHEQQLEHFVSDGFTDAPGSAGMGHNLSDGAGGMIATSKVAADGGPAEYHLTRVVGGAVSSRVIDTEGESPSLVLSGEDGTLFFSWSRYDVLTRTSTRGLSMIDAATGALVCRATAPSESSFWPLASLSDGTALVWHYSDTSSALMHMSRSCQTLETLETSFAGDILPFHPDDNAFAGRDALGAFMKLTTNPYADRTVAPTPTGQRAPKLAKVAHFVQSSGGLLLDVPPFYTIEQYKHDATVQGRTSSVFYLNSETGGSDFLRELRANPDVVVFLGDSLSWPTSIGGDGTAVGLQFVETSIIKGDRTDVVDPRDAGRPIPQFSYYVPHMKTAAKILFVGACVIGPQFKDWWNITEMTPNQAIVVPTQIAPTGLNAAAHVWLAIQEEMTSGHVSLRDAVAHANANSLVTFTIIGGNGGANIFLR